MDIATLKTLPQLELKNGIVEIIKHGLILDSQYFELLESYPKEMLRLDLLLLEKVIFESCRIKQQIVEEDERETGKRHVLNLGHTIGHAIEILSDHQISHGQAVATGIIAESYLSTQLGHLSTSDFERIVNIFKSYQIHTILEIPLTPQDFFRVFRLDKKSVENVPRFVVLKRIGECLSFDSQYCSSVDEKVLTKTLEWMCQHAMYRH
jgi:3-dehydroquinate synthase